MDIVWISAAAGFVKACYIYIYIYIYIYQTCQALHIYIHIYIYIYTGHTRWRSWLRHCASSRKVAGSIPDSVIGFFHWHNPSDRIMALGSTQRLTEMSTRDAFLCCKGDRCVGLTKFPPPYADCHEIWEPQPSGSLSRPLTGIALYIN